MFEQAEKSNQTLLHEPAFRLSVKKNYKGDIGWEYTVKGETIDEIGARNSDMLKFVNNNIEILRSSKEKGHEDSETNPEE